MNRVSALAVIAILLAGCGQTPAARRGIGDVETVEVDAGPGAELTTEFDEQAQQLDSSLAGVVPEDFPEDVPIYTPSSLVDFGEIREGWRYLEFDTAKTPPAVRAKLKTGLVDNGWLPSTAGGGVESYLKGGRRLGINLSDLHPGTRIRYEYEPRFIEGG